MVEGLEPLAPRDLLDSFVVEVVEFLHGSSFLGVPQGVRLLLVALVGRPLLVDVLGGCAHLWLLLIRVEHIGVQGFVPHDGVALVRGHRHLDVLVVLGILELALGPEVH